MTWIANIFLIIGLFLIGNKNKYSFIFTIIGESIWTIVALCTHQYDLAFICAIFTILAIRNFRRWNNENI